MSFFLSCSIDHRDLHSFPTRRSSDLSNASSGERDDQFGGVAAPVDGDDERAHARLVSNLRLRPRLRDLGAERTVGREADRKSTRLNSSHSQISYAVFCLKKKK